ncbi:MAG: glycosyltransferase family 2 protein [Acidobacteria bacterium]|nr:glycosyltransferase family 2 protein [Acidobacteriota bacterium]
MTTPEVSVIIVNYNAGDELEQALQSIAADLAQREWEAVVVDNASSDDSSASVARFAPRARVLRNDQNVGFARGVNQGLTATSAPVVLIINPDCRLVAGAFDCLLDELGRSSCAIVGPRILNPDGSAQGSARGDPDMLTGLFGRTSVLRRLLPNSAASKRNVVVDADGEERTSRTVDWLSGACLLARRDVLSTVRGFDERYFLYWEDADLCRRIRALGYQVRYVPAATAVHRVGHSSRDGRAAAIRAFHESAYLYYAIHVAPRAFFKRALARVLLKVRCRVRVALAARR